MWKYLYKLTDNGEKIPIGAPPPVGLPDARNAKSFVESKEIISANTEVSTALKEKRGVKRGQYAVYDEVLRSKIGRYATMNGNSAAVKHFTSELGRPVSESTIRSIKKQYVEAFKQAKADVKTLPHGNRGRPLKLGDFDASVQTYIRKLRIAGGIVNRTIVIAAAKGIVKSHDPSLLNSFDLSPSWARCLLERMNFVRRKGTKAARKLPTDFPAIRDEFVNHVRTVICKNVVPPQMFVNFDQTNAKFVPTSEYTLDERGSKQVSIIGMEDKREMTVLLACSLSGNLLPPQLLYAGKTTNCHPKFTFPADWDVCHTDSHWSNTNTMIRYIENILVPYYDKQRELLGLVPEQPGVALFDVFKAHQDPLFLAELEKRNIIPVFVPASCTGELQPLDLTVNGEFKRLLKNEFIEWYSNELQFLEEKESVDLRISRLKPIHASWLVRVFNSIEAKHEIVLNGFKEAGINIVSE